MVLDLLNVRAWAMESRFFERAFPVAYNLVMNGQDLSRLKDLTKEAALLPEAYERDRMSRMLLYNASNGRKIGLMKIVGGITKAGDLCSYGSVDYVRMIERANKSEAIDAIVIEMDTPGGSVDGTPELGQAIRESEKPVVVFADGMVASAGYWAASQAREIVANANNYTEIGSIGTLFVYPNYANVIEAGNFPTVKIIRAPQSKDKARVNMFEELTPDQEKAVLADLKQITEDFVATVKAGRGDRLQTGDENIFTGKMYDKAVALEMGMIDAIGSRQDAIDRAGELADGRKIPKQVRDDEKKQTGPAVSGSDNNMNSKLISFLLGGKADAEATEQLSAEEKAELETARQELTEMKDDVAAKAAKITELEAQVSTLTEEKSALETKVAEQNTTIEEQKKKLEKAPAGVATTVVTNADEFEDGNKEKKTSIQEESEAYAKIIEESKQFNLN